MTSEIILYGVDLSGHTHRVELLLRMLGLPYRVEMASADVRGTLDWLRRVEALPHFKPIPPSPIPAGI